MSFNMDTVRAVMDKVKKTSADVEKEAEEKALSQYNKEAKEQPENKT